MSITSHSRTLIALAIAAATTCGAASAAEPWVSTRTLSHPAASTGDRAVQAGQAVHVAVSLRPRHQGELDALTHALMAGRGAQPLVHADYLARFAPTPAQAEAVAAHLRQAGFTDVRIAASRLLVSADGTAATVQAAFNTSLRHVAVGSRDAFANVSDAQVPAHLAGIVSGVQGLQTVSLPHTTLKVASLQDADAADAIAAKAGKIVPHSPTDFPAIYDATGLPAATHATIGIISAGDISQTLVDLTTFVKRAGFSKPDVDQVVVGAPGFDTSGIIEWNLDSQTSLSAAGGKVGKLIFYTGTELDDASLTEAYDQAVSDDVAQVVNVSIGECETSAADSGEEAIDDAIFQAAVAQGQVFSISTGDSGSYECDSTKTSGQSYPAVSPYVMAIGGTQIQTVATTTWAGESVWSCANALACERDVDGGGGGGPSLTEAAPAWQVASGVLGTSAGRGVPDVSFDADPRSGALVVYGTQIAQVGGTSLAAPIFTGFWARLQSKNANALAFPASAIYQYGHVAANATKMFHDVTVGRNGAFNAAPGWDDASGFGSLDIGKFDAFIGTHTGF